MEKALSRRKKRGKNETHRHTKNRTNTVHIKSLTSTIHANTAKKIKNDWSLRHNRFADFNESKIALSQCNVKLQHKCDSQIQNKQQQKKRKKKVRNNNNKNILFSQRLHAAMCKTQLKPKWDFTRKPPPIKNILFKICCQKSTRTENKEPPKLVYLLLWGNQFICYCGMLRTDSR